MAEADARARISAQATEAQRRLVADIWLDNAGTEGELVERVRELWYQRIEPFSHNLATRSRAEGATATGGRRPDSWLDQARRILARLNTACGHRHFGSTTSDLPVPGLDARTSSTFRSQSLPLDIADELADHLLRGRLSAGSVDHYRCSESRRPAAPTRHSITRRITACGTSGSMHRPILDAQPIFTSGWPAGPNPAIALLFLDWLSANPGVKADYRRPNASRPNTTTSICTSRRRSPGSSTPIGERGTADATGWSPG